MTSADSYRVREIEGVAIVELVYVAGWLRMVVNIFYCLCGAGSVVGGFTGKGQLDRRVVRAVT